MLRIKSVLEMRGRAPIAWTSDGVLFLENQPLPEGSLLELRDKVGVIVHAKEFTWTPPHRDAQSLWARLRARGSAPGQMLVAYDVIPTTIASSQCVLCHLRTYNIRLICRPAPSRTRKRREFLASG